MSDVCSSDLDLVALSRDVPHLAEVDRAPVGDCFTDHKAAAQCVVRIGFEGAIRHLLHAVDVKPEGEELDRRNGVNSRSEERRGGKEWGQKGRSRWPPDN